MKLGYTLIYVADLKATVRFYETAFGLTCRFVHEGGDYAEMETGETVLAFGAEALAAQNGLDIALNRPQDKPGGWELCFVTDEVTAAYEMAVKEGAQVISPPVVKPWGQTVGYVRDLNGCLVEICSPVTAS